MPGWPPNWLAHYEPKMGVFLLEKQGTIFYSSPGLLPDSSIYPGIFLKSDHPFLIGIPEFVVHAFQAFPEGQHIDILIQNRVFVSTSRQLVIGNTRI